ncbi:tyrosinase family protein [Aspergillus undulatus]|uniref:tyrosinase family protein n=1 Tax=Aspergillus undulatus TaxID=1810928 RepID=UPI003CCCF183
MLVSWALSLLAFWNGEIAGRRGGFGLQEPLDMGHSECTPANRAVRHEWGSLTESQRLDYINALHCMQNKPPILPQEDFPGVRHRMDDFAATHINYTLHIHFSGIFFGWHRHFVYLWEKALREECGYRGHQPYWNWALSADNISASPIFDGSPTSLSGDGDHIDKDPVIYIGDTNLTIPSGSGGGCVTNGPFANMTLNLPDLSLAGDSTFPPGAFNYTPHCFTRNFNSYMSRAFTAQPDVDRLLNSPTITDLQANMDFSAWPVLHEAEIMGPHGAAHLSLGRTMDDFWTAPQDPSFFLHHAQVDRVWALWQKGGPESRRWALNGTSTIHNAPDSPEVSLDTQLTWGMLGDGKTLREVMSTEAYHLCYEYGD